jgi:predicted 3-demethylubiquinone-9 3-methyltransferase (glyoxalase superfamily)
MTQSVLPFLMFQGEAEAAVQFYVSLFPDGEIRRIDRYGPGQPGTEGTVAGGEFRVGGQTVLFHDNPVKHAFSFTPASSLFVQCGSEAEIDSLAERLADGGEVLMELANYGFSRKFTWVNDRFGVSWQINLA